MAQNPLIAALEHELADYLRRGKADRAAQVRQELARLGSSDATHSETVPPETGGTPEKAPTRARKAQERVRDAEPAKTAKTTPTPARRPKK